MLLQRRRFYLRKNVMQQKKKDAETGTRPKARSTSASQKTHLTPLKTLSELRTTDELVEALVVVIPDKLANTALRLIQPLFPTTAIARSFTHLRRFSVLQYLPTHLKTVYEGRSRPPGTLYLILPPPLPISPEVSIPAILEPYLGDYELEVTRTLVPVDPPTSVSQSNEWSHKYWPCTFNPAAQSLQNAPPLQTLRTVTEELEGNNARQVERYMSLAEEVAKQAAETGQGREIGAVIVNSSINEIVVVAGDRRWAKSVHEQQDSSCREDEGRPEDHSLMRAIAFVAERERRRRNISSANAADHTELEGLTPIEHSFFCADKPFEPTALVSSKSSAPTIDSQGRPGYLCHGLDLYITHEPCVCCSMALIHSRFRVCVFKKRMPGTGGLCAEQEDGGLGYGMFWRRELNWRTLTFQLTNDSSHQIANKESDLPEQRYHA
ncbi:MAG: hypothetical protein Q9160_006801 [Pyrenula sp. 1 TL-2023]